MATVSIDLSFVITAQNQADLDDIHTRLTDLNNNEHGGAFTIVKDGPTLTLSITREDMEGNA